MTGSLNFIFGNVNEQISQKICIVILYVFFASYTKFSLDSVERITRELLK